MKFLGTKGGVLTLDIATTAGWCYGPLDCTPQCGVWRLEKDGGEAHRLASFGNILSDFLELHEPSAMVLEGHLPLMAMKSDRDARWTFGLRAVAIVEGHHAGCPPSEVGASIVRQAVLGHSRFRKGIVKTVVMDYVRQAGFKPLTHDVADAVMVWLWFRWVHLKIAPPLAILPANLAPTQTLKRSRASIVKESDIGPAARTY